MPLKQSYVVWNNKGGSGKTTIAFHLSVQYAIEHPEENVVVIDMCPQSNISAALLSNVDTDGGGTRGDEIVTSLVDKKVDCTANDEIIKYDRTICGYLFAQIQKVKINYSGFLVRPYYTASNKFITKNLYLLCGDRYLEIMAKRLEEERKLSSEGDNPWKRVTLLIKEFIDEISQRDDKQYVFFIDTNPSFSVYTELAVSAAKRLIVPINSDDFSRSGVISVFYYLYGIELGSPRDRKYDAFKENEYHMRKETEGVVPPKIFLVINNKITSYRTRAAKSFELKAEEVLEVLKKAYILNSEVFEQLLEDTEMALQDFHTMAVQCLHLGCPLSMLPKYFEMGEERVYNRRNENYVKSLEEIVNRL